MMGGPATCVVATDDEALIDAVAGIASIAGAELEIRGPQEDLPAGRDVVILGPDAMGVRRPSGASTVVVAFMGGAPDPHLRVQAGSLGAAHLVGLPSGSGWLADALAGVGTSSGRAAPLVAVLGGGAGAGASCLAVALATSRVRPGRSVLLIDGDRWGGGLDVLLGAEQADGLRWADLAGVTGRIEGSDLLAGLPRAGSVHVLSHDRAGAVHVAADTWSAILEAARRSFDCVVVDLPRTELGHAQSSAVLRRADRVVVVVRGDVRGAASAVTVLGRVAEANPRTVLVTRATGVRVSDDVMSQAVGAAVDLRIGRDRGLRNRLDSGEAPGTSRGALRSAAAKLWGEVLCQPSAAA